MAHKTRLCCVRGPVLYSFPVISFVIFLFAQDFEQIISSLFVYISSTVTASYFTRADVMDD